MKLIDGGSKITTGDSSKIFVYGILRKGFSLDLSNYGGMYVKDAEIKNAQLYWIGNRMGVGLRFEFSKKPAQGEVWMIPNSLWSWLDEIEGVKRQVYTRRTAYTTDRTKVQLYEHTYPQMLYGDPIETNRFE
jgi:gamma-glutamylcyclotransferase (GGCT)/AIG2-like uncharacterized protein YtfP